MKRLPRFLRIIIKSIFWLFGIVTFLFLLVIGILYWKKDEIKEYIVEELNEGQGGELVIEDVNISPFRAFPYISIDVTNVTFYPDKRRFGDPLYHFEDIYVGFDILDIITGTYDVKNILVENGFVDAERYADGTLDILFFKEKDFEEEEKEEDDEDVHFNLEHIELVNILLVEESCHEGQTYNSILMDHIEAKYHAAESGLHFYIDGDFHVNDISVENYSLFYDKNFEIHTEINLLNEMSYIEFLPGTLIFGNAEVTFEGLIDTERDLYVDLKFDGKKDNFDLFYAFLPPDIVEGLNDFTNSGDIFFNGEVKGESLHGLPHIDIKLGCENTMFKNKKTDESIENLQFYGHFSSGDNNTLESSYFTLTNLFGNQDEGEFKGTFTMTNLAAPVYELDFHSSIDLEEIQRLSPIPGVEKGSGKVFIDITLNEFVDTDSLLHMATQMKDGVNSGISFQNTYIKLKDYEHAFSNINGRIELVGDDIVCENLRANIESSDIHFDLKLKNVTSLIHHYSAKVDLFLHGYSEHLNFADLLGKDQSGKEIFNDSITNLDFNLDFHAQSNALENYEYLPKVDFFFRDLRFHLGGYPHEFKRFEGLVHLSDEKIELENLDLQIGKNDLHISLLLDNPGALMDSLRQEKVTFDTEISSKFFDLMSLMQYKGESLMSEEVNKQFEKELIQNLKFHGDGQLISNSFSSHGFFSRLNVDLFEIKLNDLPKIKNTRAEIKTDTSGCIYINDFHTDFGSNDIQLDLEMRNYLNPEAKEKPIIAVISGKNWNFNHLLDDLAGRTSSTSSSSSTSSTETNQHEEAFNIFAFDFPDLKLNVDVKHLKYERYILDDFIAEMRTTPEHYIYFDQLKFKAADGSLELDGYFNGSDKDMIYLSSTLNIKNMNLDKLMYKFDNFGQDYVINENLHGIMTTKITSKAHMYPDLAVDLKNTEATIEATIKDGRIQNFAPMHALAAFMGEKDLDNIKFAELSNTITYKNGDVIVPEMKIASTLGYFYIRGKQDHDLNLDYEVDVPFSMIKSATLNFMKSKFRSRKKKTDDLDQLDDEIITEQKGNKYLTIIMKGPYETYDVEVGKVKKRE